MTVASTVVDWLSTASQSFKKAEAPAISWGFVLVRLAPRMPISSRLFSGYQRQIPYAPGCSAYVLSSPDVWAAVVVV
jgi:hypothetical protein